MARKNLLLQFVMGRNNILTGLYTRQEECCIEWLYNKTNAEISDRQTSKERFGRRMNRNNFMKSNKD